MPVNGTELTCCCCCGNERRSREFSEIFRKISEGVAFTYRA